jgi:hypothetical protein
MPATPQQLTFKESDFKERLSYDDLEDGDHLATLLDVTDCEAKTGNYGWEFKFDIKGLPISSKLWLKGGGGWKVREVFNALGEPVSPDQPIQNLNPNPLVGRQCVVTVKREAASNGATNDDGTPRMYTNITRHTPYVAEPVADFGTL